MILRHNSQRKVIVYTLILAMTFLGCVTVPAKKKNKASGPIEGVLGQNIPALAVSIDAKYYTQLDKLLPKYKILTIAITNRASGTIHLDPLKDAWKMQDVKGRWHKAINSLHIYDSLSWQTIPKKMRKLIEYPLTTPPGFTQTFDIFFPAKVDLTNFRAIKYFNAASKQKIILTRN